MVIMTAIDLVHIEILMLGIGSTVSLAMFLIWALRLEFRHLFKASATPQPRNQSHRVPYTVIVIPSPTSEFLSDLRQQRERLDKIIAALETGMNNDGNPKTLPKV